MAYSDNTLIAKYPEEFKPNPNYLHTEYAISSTERNNLNGSARIITRENGIVIWGTSGKSYQELKGSAVYSV